MKRDSGSIIATTKCVVTIKKRRELLFAEESIQKKTKYLHLIFFDPKKQIKFSLISSNENI
jgi:hypothetical protein